MVVYGGFEIALRTVTAVVGTTTEPYELIVVDNASPDGAGDLLQDRVHGATFVMNDRNLGYGAAANLGALHARGRYVGILNSDLEPHPGWLGPLISALDDDDRAGAAVPMYLEADGRVQEAGVLVGGDGRGYGYGDRWSPDHPEIGFRRYVDYGSAAAILVRSDAFLGVGGFDPIYGLGYYEDADLCFSMREAGWHIVYEPASRVTHVGHTAFSATTRLEQVEHNRPIFCGRFARQLRGRPLLRRPPFDPHKDLVLRDWWAADRVLLLDSTGRLSGLAGAIQQARPLCRVTWVATHNGRWHGPRPPGVERFDHVGRLGRWLEERRFHYSAVISDAPATDRHEAYLTHTQSQAIIATVGHHRPGWVTIDREAPIDTVLALLAMTPS
ncbi:MAG TPA: glycosyltransferase family 2 protein [Acidimicrobiales bacterium]|jgi:GT2 family glycosyltransferase|nr:glycosyltransferase family 2 protein [Acidimicrobiales bacterium]